MLLGTACITCTACLHTGSYLRARPPDLPTKFTSGSEKGVGGIWHCRLKHCLRQQPWRAQTWGSSTCSCGDSREWFEELAGSLTSTWEMQSSELLVSTCLSPGYCRHRRMMDGNKKERLGDLPEKANVHRYHIRTSDERSRSTETHENTETGPRLWKCNQSQR